MPRRVLLELRHGLLALVGGVRAAGVEPAALGRVHGGGNIALQHDALALAADLGVWHRNGGKQGLGVGVERILVELIALGQLHQGAQVHDADAVGDMAHHRQVVGNEQVRQAQLLLHVLQHVDHLGLDGHIQSGDGLVADDELGLDCQGAGNAHALLLAAGELVGIAVCVLGVQAHHAQQLFDPVGALGL